MARGGSHRSKEREPQITQKTQMQVAATSPQVWRPGWACLALRTVGYLGIGTDDAAPPRGAPKSSGCGRPPRARMRTARRGYMIAYRSASAARSVSGSSAGGGSGGGGGGGGPGMATGAAPGNACIIRPMAQCSVQRGPVAGGVVRLALAALGLDAHQQRPRAAGLAHHAGGLGGAFEEQHGKKMREARAVHGVGVGSGDVGGEAGLVGVAGEQGGDAGEASLSRWARASGVSVTGGGSRPPRVWTTW